MSDELQRQDDALIAQLQQSLKDFIKFVEMRFTHMDEQFDRVNNRLDRVNGRLDSQGAEIQLQKTWWFAVKMSWAVAAILVSAGWAFLTWWKP